MSEKTLHLKKDDERLKIGGAPEVRGDRGAEEDDQRGDSGLISDADEFEQMLQDEFDQSALPTAPKIPGYHLIWLTTTSQYDSIQKRQRIGYTAVRQSELPGFDASNGQTLAGHEGYITCNEMVLFKIEESRYQKIMAFFHHKKPLEEEGVLVDKWKEVKGKQVSSDEEDGVRLMEEEIAAKKKTPIFS